MEVLWIKDTFITAVCEPNDVHSLLYDYMLIQSLAFRNQSIGLAKFQKLMKLSAYVSIR